MVIELFGFQDQELIKQLQGCRHTLIKAGQRILDEGDEINLIPFVLNGNIKVVRTDESGREILLYTIKSGESCALSISSGLNMKPSKAIAITEEPTEAILIPVSIIREIFVKHAEMREFVMELYHKRFNEMIGVVDEIAFKHIDFRLLRLLKTRHSISGRFITATHQQLANELGTAREVVSRLLKQLEKQGLIKNHRGKIEILDQL
jgi:CRP/FNR family transcriptional regulator